MSTNGRQHTKRCGLHIGDAVASTDPPGFFGVVTAVDRARRSCTIVWLNSVTGGPLPQEYLIRQALVKRERYLQLASQA